LATTRTRAELARGIMEDLGLLDPAETMDAGDEEMILRRYDNIIAELQHDQVAYWSTDAIPYEAFEACVAVMRLVVGPGFGVPGLAGKDQNDAIDGAVQRLRKFTAKPASNQPVAAEDYF